jgi:hypothetical protein
MFVKKLDDLVGELCDLGVSLLGKAALVKRRPFLRTAHDMVDT